MRLHMGGAIAQAREPSALTQRGLGSGANLTVAGAPPPAWRDPTAAQINTQIARLTERLAQFDRAMARAGLTHRGAMAAALTRRAVFFAPGGVYARFYETLDRAVRKHEGLTDIGALATLIFRSADAIGPSRDHPRAKHFAPDRIR